MKSFLKDVFDTVFSFGGFMCAFLASILVLLLVVGSRDTNMSAQCVDAGMVKVRFDNSNYCVYLSNLNRVTAK